MTGYPKAKFWTKHFQGSISKSATDKRRNTSRKFLKKLPASYEQKNKFETMQLMKQPISAPPLININRYLSKELKSPLRKSPY